MIQLKIYQFLGKVYRIAIINYINTLSTLALLRKKIKS